MTGARFFQPVPAPHRTKRFWIFVALGILPLLGTQLLLRLIGAPPFPIHVFLISGAITLTVWSIAFWFVFRFGGIAFLFIGIILLVFGILARHFS